MKQIIAAIFIALLPVGSLAGDLPHSKPTLAQNIFQPPKAKDGFRYPDCFCTDSTGQRVELGQTTCLSIGSQTFVARCAMSVNNPIWRRVSDGCPSV